VSKPSNSIVALDKFILSTRDSGYKSTSSAVAELVDNALQASARTVRISVEATDAMSGSDIRIQVADDGVGMDRATLVQAMRFGGSGRYNDRSGLGRFGMGLPNASLGQARRVSVYTWQSGA
jgi:sensor histidine kinase regulating citrate/malate metabolism